MTKVTKKERFEEMVKLFGEMGRNDLVEFAQHEIELLEKKASSKGQTATQKANEEIKAKIIEYLVANATEKYTITDLTKNVEELEGLSNQKVSALCKQLVDSNTIAKEIDKKKSYFKALED